MNTHGILIVVSGFSGSGKGTIMKELLKRYDNYALSISATTRAPREGETDGREYFFKTREEFEKMFPATYYPYNAGEIVSAGTEEVAVGDTKSLCGGTAYSG